MKKVQRWSHVGQRGHGINLWHMALWVVGTTVLTTRQWWLALIALSAVAMVGMIKWKLSNPWRNYVPEPGWTFRRLDPEFAGVWECERPRGARYENILTTMIDSREVTAFEAVSKLTPRAWHVAIQLFRPTRSLMMHPTWFECGPRPDLAGRYNFSPAIPVEIQLIMDELPYELDWWVSGDRLFCNAPVTPRRWEQFQQGPLKVLLRIADLIDGNAELMGTAKPPALSEGHRNIWEPGDQPELEPETYLKDGQPAWPSLHPRTPSQES